MSADLGDANRSLPGDQRTVDAQAMSVAGETDVPEEALLRTAPTPPSPPPADLTEAKGHSALNGAALRSAPLPGDHSCVDDQDPSVAGDTSPPAETKVRASPTPLPSRLADTLLLIYADALDDFERLRIATENRARSLRQVKAMEGSPEEHRLLATVEGIRALEHGAELELKRALRNHPLGPWVKTTVGIGEKQGGRLLAAIGDPYLMPDGTPRTVSQLWALCGYHVLHPGQFGCDTHIVSAGVDPSGSDQPPFGDHPTYVGADLSHPADHSACRSQVPFVGGVAPRRERGQKARWNPTAKMRAFLAAEAAVKAGVRKSPAADDTDGYDVAGRTAISPLGEAYLVGRAKYAQAVHNHPCARCGPSGKPAGAGSALSEGHKHARALRLVAKQILKELWREARRLHGDDDDLGGDRSHLVPTPTRPPTGHHRQPERTPA